MDPEKKGLGEYAELIAKKMDSSAVCISLFTDDYKKGADSLLQFAIALMMDKPILLLVKKGTVIPKKVQQVADRIEFFETPDDLYGATKRLFDGFLNEGGMDPWEVSK